MSHDILPPILKKYLADELPEILETQKIPGAGVVIVKGDRVLFQQGYGYRDLEARLPVDTHTLFAIGSTSKAFTAVVLGTLVDEGKLSWDDLVIDYVPEFRTLDPVANRQMTIRDVMCHRSGLPRHDLIWLLSDFSRQRLLESIRYQQPFAPFRSRFHYNNVMWLVAGIVGERITGKSWEQNVKERIFDPLDITEATFFVSEMQKRADFACPYSLKNDQLKRVPFRSLDAIGPAGSINAHIEDYGKWLMLNLNQGCYQGRQVISAANLAEIHAPQMAMPVDDELASAFRAIKEFSDLVYTFGWVSVHFRGRRHIMHAGGIDGFSAFITLLPDEQLGVGVLTNKGEINSHYAITWEIVDRFLGDAPGAWVALISGFEKLVKENETHAEEEAAAAQVSGTSPSHPLQAYCGDYRHPAYGTLTICEEGGQLAGSYNRYPVTFKHYHYDVFQMLLDDGSIEHKFNANFASDVKGQINRVFLPLEARVDEIEFVRAAQA